jgi:UDP-N-acetylmuramoyl-L-alanyl-D-glutamate--2,6-diaminopimelate ligase
MLVAGEQGQRSMPLQQLLGHPVTGDGEVMVTGIQLDSRLVEEGDVFLAMPGELHDGRQFIEQAVANGAAAVIAESPVGGFVDEIPVPLVEVPELRQDAGHLAARFFGYPSRDLHMVGVTGTNGKTTTSRLFAQLGRAMGKTCGVIGTLGATLQDDVAEAGNTTPDPISLQRQLAEWCKQGVFAVAMEVSSHALAQGRVNGVDFETAVFTNLSHDHLDYHGSMDAYGRAKLALFSRKELSHAVINVDDDFAPRVTAVVDPDTQVVTCSTRGADADVQVRGARFHAKGVRAELSTPWGSGTFDSPLPGDFNLANLAAAITAMVLAGEELPAVLAAVARLKPVPGRMELVPNEAGLEVIVDYAHTPDALHQVLSSLRRQVDGALVTVFGCGGDRDREKRQLMGRVACELSDRVIVTSDNPRSESPADILRDVEQGCSGDYLLVEDRAEAIARAVREGRPGDCIVIAGKGHEDYQVVEGERLYFSDIEQARAALAARAGS